MLIDIKLLKELRQAAIEKKLAQQESFLAAIEDMLTKNTLSVYEQCVAPLCGKAETQVDEELIKTQFGCLKQIKEPTLMTTKDLLYQEIKEDPQSSIWDDIPNHDDIYFINTSTAEDRVQNPRWKLFRGSVLQSLAKQYGLEAQLITIDEEGLTYGSISAQLETVQMVKRKKTSDGEHIEFYFGDI